MVLWRTPAVLGHALATFLDRVAGGDDHELVGTRCELAAMHAPAGPADPDEFLSAAAFCNGQVERLPLAAHLPDLDLVPAEPVPNTVGRSQVRCDEVPGPLGSEIVADQPAALAVQNAALPRS